MFAFDKNSVLILEKDLVETDGGVVGEVLSSQPNQIQLRTGIVERPERCSLVEEHPLNFCRYQEYSKVFCKYPEEVLKEALIFGMFGEFGEYTELWKKSLRKEGTLNHNKAVEELGDFIWYTTQLLTFKGVELAPHYQVCYIPPKTVEPHKDALCIITDEIVDGLLNFAVYYQIQEFEVVQVYRAFISLALIHNQTIHQVIRGNLQKLALRHGIS